MSQNNRRSFIRNASLSLGALGSGTFSLFAGNEKQIGPAKLIRKTINLWPDQSVNNGTDPAKRSKLDFFIPETAGDQKLAAIIVCPGGGYGGLSPHEGAPFAELFAANGIIGVVLTYRVFPNHYPGSYSDAARAIRLLRSQAESLNIDPGKIGIIGFSAGGHLAATIATQPDLYIDPEDNFAPAISARPNRVMLGYPVISFEEFAHKGSAWNLLGERPDPAMLHQLSNQKQVTAKNPPAFLFHTADDNTVPVQNSLLFAEACIKQKVPVALHIYPKGMHGVGLALNNQELNGWSGILIKWLDDWHAVVNK